MTTTPRNRERVSLVSFRGEAIDAPFLTVGEVDDWEVIDLVGGSFSRRRETAANAMARLRREKLGRTIARLHPAGQLIDPDGSRRHVYMEVVRSNRENMIQPAEGLTTQWRTEETLTGDDRLRILSEVALARYALAALEMRMPLVAKAALLAA